jgi:hypothetical protein
MSINITLKDIQLRRNTESYWSTQNPTPLAGEPVYSTDVNGLKIGDGSSNWNSLNYLTSSGGGGGLTQEEIEDFLGTSTLIGGSNIDITYNDGAGTITFDLDNTGLDAATVNGLTVQTAVPVGALFTDTTYSIGDGGLTEINFTSADNSKLDGIEANATADQTGAEIEGLLDTELTNIRWKEIEVPAGGTTGQVLKKNSNTDYDYSWAADLTSGGGSSNSAADYFNIYDNASDNVAGITFTPSESASSTVIDGIAVDVVNHSLNFVANSITNFSVNQNAVLAGNNFTLLNIDDSVDVSILQGGSSSPTARQIRLEDNSITFGNYTIADIDAAAANSATTKEWVNAQLLDENIVAAASATNYTPSAANVEGHISGIDIFLGDAIISDESVVPNGVKVNNIVAAPQADIEALGSPDPNTLYVPNDAVSYEYVQVACSDLETDITAGTNKGFTVSPVTGIVTNVYVDLLTAGTATGITVDINKNGTTILSTKLTTDATETSSRTAITLPIISVSAISEGDRLTFDFDSVPTGGRGVVVTMEIQKN